MPSTNYQRFLNATGRRIQTLRKSRGLSQEQLAEKLGMDRVSVGYIEQGRRSPKLSTVFAISRVLDVRVFDLFEDVEASLEREAVTEVGRTANRVRALRPRALPGRGMERGDGDGLSL